MFPFYAENHLACNAELLRKLFKLLGDTVSLREPLGWSYANWFLCSQSGTVPFGNQRWLAGKSSFWWRSFMGNSSINRRFFTQRLDIVVSCWIALIVGLASSVVLLIKLPVLLRFADLAGFGEWETLAPGERLSDQWTSGQPKKHQSVTVEKPSTLMDVHGFVSGASASYPLVNIQKTM